MEAATHYSEIKVNIEQKLNEMNWTGVGRAAPETGRSYTADDIDRASELRDKEVANLVTCHTKRSCDSLLAALERLAEGSYGLCSECGDQINMNRLLAHPTSLYCVPCQSKKEKAAKRLS